MLYSIIRATIFDAKAKGEDAKAKGEVIPARLPVVRLSAKSTNLQFAQASKRWSFDAEELEHSFATFPQMTVEKSVENLLLNVTSS